MATIAGRAYCQSNLAHRLSSQLECGLSIVLHTYVLFYNAAKVRIIFENAKYLGGDLEVSLKVRTFAVANF